MGKKKNQKSNKKKDRKEAAPITTSGKQQKIQAQAANLDFADYLAILPGFLMCAMLVIILVLDIAVPGMSEKQYEDFPNIFTFMDYVAISGGLLYIAVSAKRRDLRFEKTDIFFAGFALLIIVSTAVNGLDELTMDGVPYRYIGIFNMFAFMLIYMGVTRSIKRESFGNVILTGYLLVADLIALVAIYDRFTGSIEAFSDKKELSAVFFNGNHYGYFLLMAVLIGVGYYLFSDGSQAVIGAASAALNSVLLAINHSLGCILALIIVLTVTGVLIAIKDRDYLKRFMMLIAVMIVLFILALLVSPALRKEFTGLAADLAAILSNTAEGSAGHRRLQMWRLTAGYISKKPLLGYGCEGIAFMLYEAMKVSNPHCEVLTYAAYYGIPAAILYLTGVVAVLITGIRRMDSNGVQQKAACMAATGYFISSFVGVGMFYTLPFFFIFLGLSQKR